MMALLGARATLVGLVGKPAFNPCTPRSGVNLSLCLLRTGTGQTVALLPSRKQQPANLQTSNGMGAVADEHLGKPGNPNLCPSHLAPGGSPHVTPDCRAVRRASATVFPVGIWRY